MGRDPDGILLIDKEEGESSFAVVRRVKGILKARKVGHAGTLDPFATGLLVILLGQGTKLFDFLTAADKEYCATLRLGTETDTLDLTGRVVRTLPVPPLEPGFIRETARGLVGEIEQTPPAFSAVHYEGKRAYELARKGVSVPLEKRKVRIHRLDVTSVALPEVVLSLTCSKGTYVRSLAAELGMRLGTGGHLSALRRISSGSFRVGDALRLQEGGAAVPEELMARVIPLSDALSHVREVQVDPETARRVRDGVRTEGPGREFLSDLPVPFDGAVKLVEGNRVVAILQVVRRGERSESRFEILRVFA